MSRFRDASFSTILVGIIPFVIIGIPGLAISFGILVIAMVLPARM